MEKEKKSRRRTIIKELNLEPGVAPPVLKLSESDAAHTVYVKPAGVRQVVNVVALLLNEQLGAALERFNVCACQKCCYEITCRVLKEIKPTFIHVSTFEGVNEVNRKLDEMRPEVIKVIAKTVMASRIKPYHAD